MEGKHILATQVCFAKTKTEKSTNGWQTHIGNTMIVTSKGTCFCNIKQCFGSMNCTLLLSQPFHKGVCTKELHPDVSQS